MSMTGKQIFEETAEDWDERFSGGWQKVGGSIQSLTFMIKAWQILLSKSEDLVKLSEWEINNKIIMLNKFVIHDYGCALGDGTAYLKILFPGATLTGFDFSTKAVEVAKKRWPTVNFEAGNIENVKKAGIIYTSHTIEHLKNPVKTIFKCLKKCKLLIVVIPFITEDKDGGHTGAETTNEMLKKLPKPLLLEDFVTIRDDPEKKSFLPEKSLLLVWKGDL